MTGFAEAALLTGVLLAVLAWIAVVIAVPITRDRVQDSPTRRAAVARAWLYAPLWVPIALLLAVTLPGTVVELRGGADHCLQGTPAHHHHLCFVHPPHLSGSPIGWIAPLSIAVFVIPPLAKRLTTLRSEQRLAHVLAATGRPDGARDGVRVLDRGEPIAMAVGGPRGHILLSSGLLARASAVTIEVILAHERAHLDRRDQLRFMLDRSMASLMPGHVSRVLLARLTLAREQSCDAVAARSAGGPLAVATALAEVVRLGIRHPVAGLSVASGSIESRVRWLLEPPAPPLLRRRIAEGLVALGAGILLSTSWVHHAVERFVTHLVH